MRIIVLLLALVGWAGAWAPVPRALPDPLGSSFGHPAVAAGDYGPSVQAAFWNGPQQRALLGAYTPIDPFTALVLGYARSEPWKIENQELDAGGVVRLYSGTWVGARAEFRQTPETQELDFSLGAFYRPSQHVALAWDVRHLLETLDNSSLDEKNRTFGLGAALFADTEERVALYGDISAPGFSTSDLKAFSALAGVRLRTGDSLRFEFACGAGFVPDSSQKGKDVEGYWRLGLGFPLAAHRLELQFGGEDYTLKGRRDDPSMRLAIGLQWDALRDRKAPLAYAQLDSMRIFHIHTQDASPLLDWQLLVHAAGSDFVPRSLVRRFAGTGAPPDRIPFDGNDHRGKALAPGIYAFRLLVRDVVGNGAWSSWQFVELP